MNRCIITFTSFTLAMKAQRTLDAYTIPCEMVKLSAKESQNGCTHGLSLNCLRLDTAADIISQKGIEYGKLIRL